MRMRSDEAVMWTMFLMVIAISTVEGAFQELEKANFKTIVAGKLHVAACRVILKHRTTEGGTVIHPPNVHIYNSHLNCHWTIMVPFGKTIKIEIVSKIKYSENCKEAGLTVTDGYGLTVKELSTVCGVGNITLFTTSRIMTLRMFSVLSGNEFSAIWTTDACPGKLYNGHCYKAVPTKKTFQDAASHCYTLGATAHLVDFLSANDEAFVTKLLQTADPKAKSFWIGGKQMKVGTKTGYYWFYQIIEIQGYTNWLIGQPIKAAIGSECMCKTAAGAWKWTFANCQIKKPFVCQY